MAKLTVMPMLPTIAAQSVGDRANSTTKHAAENAARAMNLRMSPGSRAMSFVPMRAPT
jgi:hypothetical protein